MSSKFYITVFFLLTFLFTKIEAASTSPVWIASSYFKAGSITFTFSTLTTTSQNSTITYSSALINTTLKVPTLGITDLGYIIQTGRIYLLLDIVSYTTTNLKFQVDVNQNNCLTSLKITYMALDNMFKPAFSMRQYYPVVKVNGSTTPINSQFYVNFTSSTGVTLNTSHENVLLPFMHYIDLTTYDNTVDINLNFTVCNASFYTVIISSTSKMYLSYAGFSRLIFDKTAIEAMGNDYFNYGIISSINNNATMLSTVIPPDIISSNLFYGMHSFTISTGLSCLNYSSAYTINTGAIGYTSLGTYNYAKMKFSYIHHKTRTCPTGYPYYNISQMLCYDHCNNRWYGDLSSSTCQPCLYDCFTCTSGTTCTTCSSTIDFRAMNGTRCSPISGYFDNNTNSSAATPCTSPCSTCSGSATYCITCINGAYLSSNKCKLCSLIIPSCQTCTNGSYCTLCNDGSSGISCTSCSSDQYLNTTTSTCITCSSVISNCQSCSSSTTCILCKSSFTQFSATNCSCTSTEYISGGQCYFCSSAINYCSTCTSATSCTSCLTTFILINSTICSCNSTSFLNDTSLQCQPCTKFDPYCQTCSNLSCTQCSPSFTLSNGSCICGVGYYINTTFSSCQSCPSAIINCIECLSAAECSLCNSGYSVNITTGLCDPQPCQVANCFTCNNNNFSQCILCDTGYSLASAIVCSIICGDGNLHSSQKCDDGNLNNQDGCSSICIIQNNFSCVAQYQNATLTYSACYYTGSISFDLIWIRKIQGSNTLKFMFQLNQHIAEWKYVNFTAILEIDTVDTSTNFTKGMTAQIIKHYETQYYLELNRFSVTLEYITFSLQKQHLSFALYPYAHGTYPAFTPPSNIQFWTPTIHNILKVVANNNQNANLYSDKEYKLYEISLYMTWIILGIILFTVFTSLLFRTGNVITFEMITIAQISYFSLAFLDSLNPIFSGLLPLRYLTGILNFKNVQEYLQETQSPNSMKGVYMFLNLSSNFNFIALSLCIFIAFGSLLIALYYIIDFCANKNSLKADQIKKEERKGYCLYRLAFYFIGELALSLIILCLPLYTISLFFEVLFTINNDNFWSYGQAFGIGLIILAYFIAVIKQSFQKQSEFNQLGEFIGQFNGSSCFNKFKYINFQILETTIISGLVMLTIYSDSKVLSTLCIIFLSFFDIIIVAVVKPYKFGFVSCWKGQENDAQGIFQKIQLYKVYNEEQPQFFRIENPDQQITKAQNTDLSQIFAQHFAVKKNIIKTNHQGLIQAGKIINQPKLYLFNNNIRRIVNLSTLISIEFVFVCSQIYQQQINKSYQDLTIQMFLPIFIHFMLFLNGIYNYFTLILQIINRTKISIKSIKIDNIPDSANNFIKSLKTRKQNREINSMTNAQQSIENPKKTIINPSQVLEKKAIQPQATDDRLFKNSSIKFFNPFRKQQNGRRPFKMKMQYQ